MWLTERKRIPKILSNGYIITGLWLLKVSILLKAINIH